MLASGFPGPPSIPITHTCGRCTAAIHAGDVQFETFMEMAHEVFGEVLQTKPRETIMPKLKLDVRLNKSISLGD